MVEFCIRNTATQNGVSLPLLWPQILTDHGGDPLWQFYSWKRAAKQNQNKPILEAWSFDRYLKGLLSCYTSSTYVFLVTLMNVKSIWTELQLNCALSTELWNMLIPIQQRACFGSPPNSEFFLYCSNSTLFFAFKHCQRKLQTRSMTKKRKIVEAFASTFLLFLEVFPVTQVQTVVLQGRVLYLKLTCNHFFTSAQIHTSAGAEMAKSVDSLFP